MALTRAQIKTNLVNTITDELERQNTAAIVRERLGEIIDNCYNIAEDNLEITTDTTPTDGSTNPVQSNGVFDALATKLNLSGGTMSGSINMGGNNLTHVAMIFDQDNIAAFLKSGGYRTITGVDGEGIFYLGTLGQGVGIRSFGSSFRAYLMPPASLPSDVEIQTPNESGTLALTSDIPEFGTTAGTAAEGNDSRFSALRHMAIFTGRVQRALTDVHLLYLGDSTTEGLNNWPHQNAIYIKSLYPTHTVNVYFWNATTKVYGSATQIGATGTGVETTSGTVVRTIHVYIGAVNGSAVAYSTDAANAAILPSVDVSAVILSYGHNDTASDYRKFLMATRKNLRKKYRFANIIWTAQNPKAISESAYENGLNNQLIIKTFAASEGDGLLNFYQIFKDYGDYETDLLGDTIHPNQTGKDLEAAEANKLFVKSNMSDPQLGINTINIITIPATSFWATTIDDAPNSTLAPTQSFVSEGSNKGTGQPCWVLPANAISAVSCPLVRVPYEWRTAALWGYFKSPVASGGIGANNTVYLKPHTTGLSEGAPVVYEHKGDVQATINVNSAWATYKVLLRSMAGTGEWSPVQPNDPMSIHFLRNGSAAGDTFENSIYFLGVELERLT